MLVMHVTAVENVKNGFIQAKDYAYDAMNLFGSQQPYARNAEHCNQLLLALPQQKSIIKMRKQTRGVANGSMRCLLWVWTLHEMGSFA